MFNVVTLFSNSFFFFLHKLMLIKCYRIQPQFTL